MAKRPNLTKLPALRANLSVNQRDFWSVYSVTQSAGSRYESAKGNRAMPQPLAMLLWLHQTGRLTDQDLKKARTATSEFARTRPAARGARK